MGIKFSQFGSAGTPTQNDVVVGLQDGTNRKFSLGALLAWIKGQISPADIGAVPNTRKINTKPLNADISLTAADVSAIPSSEKGAASGVATLNGSGKVPAAQLDLSGKQDEITASGILKGNGAGGVTAAVAGTDYSTPSQLAPVETGTTASQAYAVGDYFCWNGLLYRAMAAISAGQSFTPGTNCVPTTVMAEGRAEVIWTNPNTTSAFAAQTVSLQLGLYDFIIIEYRGERTLMSAYCQAIVYPDDQTVILQALYLPSSAVLPVAYQRTVRASGNGVSFNAGGEKPLSAAARTVNNDAVWPYAIIGVKL